MAEKPRGKFRELKVENCLDRKKVPLQCIKVLWVSCYSMYCVFTGAWNGTVIHTQEN